MFRLPSLRRTVAAALRDAASPSEATRASALADLVHHAETARAEVLGALEGGLRDQAAAVRAAAAIGLADVQGAEALSSLLVAVEDDDGYVRQMALAAIGELGDSRAGERLRRALSDSRPEVRFQAVIAFTRVVADEAMQAIEQALDDADASIRYIAVRCAEEYTLGEDRPLPPKLLARAAALLADPDATVRVAAAVLLSRSGQSAGVPLLVDVVRGRLSTREQEDEAAAVELLGELGVTEAVPHLERRAFAILGFGEGRFAWQALVSLARMGHVRARARIMRDLRSWSRDRRTLAVAAAGRAQLAEARPIVEAMRGDEARADGGTVMLALDQLTAGVAAPGGLAMDGGNP
ncbi:MAG TPA: HEAT repeat domain-containing protein [Polyangiaceae bacterium]|nr:HEAT repeat domain-containing protein [Polyangiaceae bacterium]